MTSIKTTISLDVDTEELMRKLKEVNAEMERALKNTSALTSFDLNEVIDAISSSIKESLSVSKVTL